MTKVVALVSFSTGALSMYQGEIADIDSTLAIGLIRDGFVEEYVNPIELPSVTASDNGDVLSVVNGKWNKADAPSGGGLPEPTTEGDVLGVGYVADPSVIILPEQTLEIDETDYYPTGGNPSIVTDGMKVCITCNGVSSIETASVTGDDENAWIYIPFHPYGIVTYEVGLWYSYADERWNFYDYGYLEGDPLTISVVGTQLVWKEDEFAVYDIVIMTDRSFTDNLSDYSIVKYNKDDVASKVRAGELVTGVLCQHFNYDVAIVGDTDNKTFPLTSIGMWTDSGEIRFNWTAGYTSGGGTSLVITSADIKFNLNSDYEFVSVTASQITKMIS